MGCASHGGVPTAVHFFLISLLSVSTNNRRLDLSPTVVDLTTDTIRQPAVWHGWRAGDLTYNLSPGTCPPNPLHAKTGHLILLVRSVWCVLAFHSL